MQKNFRLPIEDVELIDRLTDQLGAYVKPPMLLSAALRAFATLSREDQGKWLMRVLGGEVKDTEKKGKRAANF